MSELQAGSRLAGEGGWAGEARRGGRKERREGGRGGRRGGLEAAAEEELVAAAAALCGPLRSSSPGGRGAEVAAAAAAAAVAAKAEARGWGDAALSAHRGAVPGLRLLLAPLRLQPARRVPGGRSGRRWREAAGRGGFLARGRRTRRRERGGQRGTRSSFRPLGQVRAVPS